MVWHRDVEIESYRQLIFDMSLIRYVILKLHLEEEFQPKQIHWGTIKHLGIPIINKKLDEQYKDEPLIICPLELSTFGESFIIIGGYYKWRNTYEYMLAEGNTDKRLEAITIPMELACAASLGTILPNGEPCIFSLGIDHRTKYSKLFYNKYGFDLDKANASIVKQLHTRAKIKLSQRIQQDNNKAATAK